MKDLYFSHDRNAMSDNRISELRGIYRMEGYGVYWGIVEALSREPDFTLPLTDRNANALAESMHPSFDMSEFINTCIDIGLFKTDGNRFWSDSLCRRMQEVSVRAEISRKRSEAAKQSWINRTNAKDASDASVEHMKNCVIAPVQSPVDPDWKRVADAYEREIGMLPTGTAVDTLVSYYDDLGADAMIVAIRRTNEAQPDSPFSYLKSILESFIKRGVSSGQEAEACCIDFDRRKSARTGRDSARQDDARDELTSSEIRWLD